MIDNVSLLLPAILHQVNELVGATNPRRWDMQLRTRAFNVHLQRKPCELPLGA